jgi:hypothetical protein
MRGKRKRGERRPEEKREGEVSGPAERKKGGGVMGRPRVLGCFPPFFFFLLSFFFSTLKPFKQNHLNSNKFEFKPYKLNTRKTMLQHECTNMLIL